MNREIWSIVVLIILSALFSASETALTAISRIKVRKLLDQKRPAAKIIHFLKDNPAKMLATILVCNNIVNTLAAVLAGGVAESYFSSIGLHNEGVAVGAATTALTFVLLVFGEITPKTLAIRNAERISLWLGPMIGFLEILLRPVVSFLTFISRPLIFLFGGHGNDKGPILTEEEIKSILSVGEKEGIIEENEHEMISSIFDFGDTLAKEVMTPRPDMQVIDVTTPSQEALKMIMDFRHSRIPVFEGNIDNIIGIVYAKDLLGVEQIDLREKMRAAVFIPESKKIDAILKQMQAAKTHIVVVVDEYGSVAGLVSMEDIIEEIFGEIQDEFERNVKAIEKISESSYLVDGSVLVSDLNQSLSLNLPESRQYDTIAGLMSERLEKVPAIGDRVRIDEVVLLVERVHHRRIGKVKISLNPLADAIEMVGG